MDDYQFDLIASLPGDKWHLITEDVKRYHQLLGEMKAHIKQLPPASRRQAEQILDPKQYQRVTAWGPLCKQCGRCCRSLIQRPRFFDFLLERGRCKHYDSAQRQCDIYEHRPLTCRVDDLYDLAYHRVCTRAEYYAYQATSCYLLTLQLP